MFKLSKKLRLSVLGMLYGMMVAMPAVAEDIEIYKSTGSTTQTTQANVLFVLDTSGSMDGKVYTRAPYDPNTDYSSFYACYDNNRVYVIPGSVNDAQNYCIWSGGWWWWGGSYEPDTSLSQVNRPAVVCDKASSLDTVGYYTGRVSQYRSGSWRDSIANDKYDKFVECEKDNGIHGQSSGGLDVWASSTNGPWASAQSDSINWGNVGISTTLYSGNYLNYIIDAPVTVAGTRITVMQQVIEDLVNSTTGINIGLMRFDEYYGEGGMVAAPVEDIATSKTEFINQLNAMKANGVTPLSETFYEAVRYMQGSGVDYGDTSTPFHSVPSSRSGGGYKSPIVDECQKNYIILLTDGDPYYDYLSSTRQNNIDVNGCSGNCLDEIAKTIGSTDQSSTVDGDQFISTFTIGFAITNQLLKDTAKESFNATGVGEYYLADDAITLADTLNQIFANIYETDTSFTTPAVSVNAFNRATHLDDLYFTLFKPAIGNRWPGNFKKYKLDFFVDTNDVDSDGDVTERLPFIADANGLDAVGNTGFFADTSRSFWTDGANDGADVTAGGAAGELVNVSPRKVVTFTDTYNNNSGVFTPGSSASAKLTSAANAVDKSNTAITESMLGIVGKPDKINGIPLIETLLDWAAGLDVFDVYGSSGTTTDLRPEMGDPLHSEPALVQYGGTVANPDLVSYVATNDGYLHAIDVDDGTELFAFIPQELLPNLNELLDNNSGNKTYGLDGNVVAWVNDINNDGVISGSDHVYLYVSMRRGGRNIYSLDVTDRDNPTLRWVIKGGVGDYAELGQTWSGINVEKIKDGSSEKTVLVFGGGYDTNQDGVTVRSSDSVGRAVYIADATSGEMLWSAGAGGTLPLTEMQYSVPARIKPLDINGDGNVDRLYMADMGGQIFRFDIDESLPNFNPAKITGGRIADLAGSAKVDARRFYYPPDVAIIAEKGKSAYLALAIASGYRAHPLDTVVHDRIYVLKDKDIFNAPSAYVTLTESDLYDATLNLVAGDGTAAENKTALTDLENAEGWYISLDNDQNRGTWLGEKGLSEPLILDGVVVVTTFTPTNSSSVSSSCKPQSGTGKVYFLDILDASAAYPGNLDIDDERVKSLAQGGIPPSPNVVITKKGDGLCVGVKCMAADFGSGVRKTFWYEVEK